MNLAKAYVCSLAIGALAAGILSSVLSGCAGTDDQGDDMELGTAEEAFAVAQCKSSAGHYYGVDTSTWDDRECNTAAQGATCYFPLKNNPPSAIEVPVDPSGIHRGTGWGSAWAQFKTNGDPAAAVLDGYFFGNCTNRSGQPAFAHFGIVANPSSTPQYVTLHNGTLPTVALGSANGQDLSVFLHFGCAAGLQLNEGEAMASATWCTRLDGTLDYNKLRTWAAAGGGGAAAQQRAIQNVVQKIYALSMGIGLNTVGLSTTINNEQVRRDILQNGWSGDQRNWVCNYNQFTQDAQPFLNCN